MRTLFILASCALIIIFGAPIREVEHFKTAPNEMVQDKTIVAFNTTIQCALSGLWCAKITYHEIDDYLSNPVLATTKFLCSDAAANTPIEQTTIVPIENKKFVNNLMYLLISVEHDCSTDKAILVESLALREISTRHRLIIRSSVVELADRGDSQVPDKTEKDEDTMSKEDKAVSMWKGGQFKDRSAFIYRG